MILTDALTESELATLRLLAKDLTALEIGERVGVCEDTVFKRLTNIRDKLGCKTNCGALAMAISAGIIE